MAVSSKEVIRNHASFIWSVADLLRGDYKPYEYGRGILPLVVLRRLDCVLELTKPKVLAAASRLAARWRTSTRSSARRRASSSTTRPP